MWQLHFSNANMSLIFALYVGLVLFLHTPTNAQTPVVDRILAVIDEEVVLQSDVDRQYNYYIQNGKKDDGSLKCIVFENLLNAKLILAKARLDSVKVSDSQVEEEINSRVNQLVRQLNNSVEELEKIYKKSLVELKIELRPTVMEELLVEEQRRKIFSTITITPKETKEYFNSIPKDSLPYLPAEIEMSHIVMRPEASEANQNLAKAQLEAIREKIVKGELKFADAAALHSQDFGSARNGGSLGKFGKGSMVPEFEEVAYNMSVNEVSRVFKSPFGFHIILLQDRNLDQIEASHILIRPEISLSDEERVKQKLKQIRSTILRDSITFAVAAEKYSQDPQSKHNGGRVTLGGNDFRIPLDKLDADLYLKIDNMKIGDISEPMEIITTQGDFSKAFHIIWMQNKTQPHKANLKDDYQKFFQAAKQNKQAEQLDNWFQKTKKQVFIEIKDNDCSQALQNWN